MRIEQALYGSDGSRGYHFLGQSPGFLDAWRPDAERLCMRFGERPAGTTCPLALFVQPFGKRHVAVVQVADRGIDDAGRPGALAFHLLILPRGLYADLGGNPFFLAERFPPPWSERGLLPTLEFKGPLPPRRTLEVMHQNLNVPNSATLLGGAQVLLDGGRLAFERKSPDNHLVSSLWNLLPYRTRAELWPATFAFGNALRFHLVVTPRASGPEFEGYVFEEQAGDYPEGRYELALQTAVESGDQGAVDALFSRRSRSQTMTLGLTVLAMLVFIPLVAMVLTPSPVVERAAELSVRTARIEAVAKLPAVEDCPRLTDRERTALADRLQQLGKNLDLKVVPDNSSKAISTALGLIDRRLAARDNDREIPSLAALGPIQRQLRALLWKHDVAGYDDPRLNLVELVDRLEQDFTRRRIEVRPHE